MKNVIEVYSSTVTKVEKVFVCYGHKTYRKFSKKRYKADSEDIIKDQKKIVGEAISKRLYAELNDLVDEE